MIGFILALLFSSKFINCLQKTNSGWDKAKCFRIYDHETHWALQELAAAISTVHFRPDFKADIGSSNEKKYHPQNHSKTKDCLTVKPDPLS